jgi:cysteine-rich repeat protein
VVARSTTTGESLALAIFGEPTPGCGNGITDAGEDCDDGNTIDTDACVACKAAACGDGFVRAGVEVCGDAPATPAATRPRHLRPEPPALRDSGGRQSVKVRSRSPRRRT